MKIKAITGKVIVKNLMDEKKTPGGIIIPESHKEKNMMGLVVDSAVNGIEEGDYVLFGRYSGVEHKPDPLEPETYRSIPSSDILARTNGTWDAIAPVSNYLLVEPVANVEKKVNGIIQIAKDQKEMNIFEAKVIRTGPGALHPKSGKLCQMTVKEGDTVYYGEFVSYSLKKWGRDFVIVRESDLELVKSC